jgi:hypothetical protein
MGWNHRQSSGGAARRQAAGPVFGTSCVWLALLGAALALAGCAGGGAAKEDREAAFIGVATPYPPAFLTGPASILLTNSGGYTAHVVLNSGADELTKTPASGELLCLGPWLLYAPGQETPADKRTTAGGFTFLWNVAESRGFLLSETLQGYAPIGDSVRPTNFVAVPAEAAPERLEGHPCQLEDVLVHMSDGTNAAFRVWRAGDLKAMPVRLISLAASAPVSLTLSRIRLSPPSPELFAPPASFTKYANPAVLADELAIRDRNLRRKPAE